MNIPVGKIVASGLLLKDFDFLGTASKLCQGGFSGYLVLTSDGHAGLEEGLLMFRSGEIIGCVFEFLKFPESFFALDALKLLLNSSKSRFGIVDIVELSKQQAELVVAFNDKMGFEESFQAKGLTSLVPSNYEKRLVELFVGEKLRSKESRFDVLKKIGLKGL